MSDKDFRLLIILRKRKEGEKPFQSSIL